MKADRKNPELQFISNLSEAFDITWYNLNNSEFN